MRLPVLAIGALQLISATAHLAGSVSQVAASGHDLRPDLSPCVQECFGLLSCTSDNLSCYCADEAFLDVEACALSNCTVREAFVAKHHHRTECGIPERDRSGILVKSIWCLFTFSILAVLLRLIARMPMLGGVGVGWDDWVILMCLFPLTNYDIMLNVAVGQGLGKDMWTLSPVKIDGALLALYITIFSYTVVLSGVQVSITLLYIRVFGGAYRKFRALCIGIIALCVCSGLTACIGAFFYCSRISLFWTSWNKEHHGSCHSLHYQIYTMAAINIFLDLVILSLPIPLLRNLHASLERRIGLAATFLIGLLATCASIVRLRYIVVWGKTANPTWDYNLVAVVSSFECHLAVICACMPSMAGLLKRLLRKKKVSETPKTQPAPHQASTSEEALCKGVELVVRRPRGGSVRVATTLDEFLATGEGKNSADLELKQRGIDHATAEIERLKTLERDSEA